MDQDKTTVMGGYGSAQAGDSADATRVVPNPGYTDPAATPFALEVMQHMNDACKRWKEATDIDFSLYGANPGYGLWRHSAGFLCRIFARPLWQRSSGPV